MEKEEKLAILKDAYEQALLQAKAHNKGEFAEFIGVNRSALSAALNGNEVYLTDRLIGKVMTAMQNVEDTLSAQTTIPVLPTGARAGTLVDFADSVSLYECEKIISPIRGADFAMQVTGDSMSPEYPSGSQIIIKRIDEKAFIEWGKVYVLDTRNGAVIKQIRKTDNPEEVECVSLNPAYQPFTLNTQYVNGWYRVLMVLALK